MRLQDKIQRQSTVLRRERDHVAGGATAAGTGIRG
jgi:hypothetical protein